MLPSDFRQFQTTHGRAQRKAFGLVCLVVLGLLGVLRVWGSGTLTWGDVAAAWLAVAACFAFAALRREDLGLYVTATTLRVHGLVSRTTIDNTAGSNVRWDDQGDLQYLRLRTKRGRWRRVPYMTHRTERSPIRRLYPPENQLLERVAGSGWKPTGVTWTDERGADAITEWLALRHEVSKPKESSLVDPADRLTPAELAPSFVAITVPLVLLAVIVTAFDKDPILVWLDVVLMAATGFWALRRVDKIQKSKATATMAQT